MNVPGFVGGVLSQHRSKLGELRTAMNAAGYALVDRNDNPWCSHCTEVVLAVSNISEI
jgi:hypothetical protein